MNNKTYTLNTEPRREKLRDQTLIPIILWLSLFI